jgi:spoIIIJ-associated protein
MEEKVSELLENILGLLGMEGSFEVEEKEEGIFVSIETNEPGKLIGKMGETLSSLQLILNLALSRQMGDQESKEAMELLPMPAWQRRIVHMTIEQTPGVSSESVGEGADRHMVLRVDESKNA